MRTLLTLLALCMLCGCAAVQSTNQKIAQDVQNIVEPIKQATITDAQAALADAQAAGDQDGAACFQDIINFLNQQGSAPPQIAGVLSGMEVARTFKAPSLPPQLHKDCAVLVVDAQEMALKLGLTLAPVAGAVKVQAGSAALRSEAAALGAKP